MVTGLSDKKGDEPILKNILLGGARFRQLVLGYLHFSVYLILLIIFVVVSNYYISTRYHYWIPTLIEYFYPIIFGFILALICIPLCIKVARHFSIQDSHKEHKEHLAPTPLLGGAGIYFAFLIILLFYQPWTQQMTAIVIAASIIVIIGTIDDIRPLSSSFRLIGQVGASCLVIMAGVKISFMPHTWWGEILTVIITLIWILGIVNATNFVDGVDGLAAGFAVIAGIFFFVITLHHEQFNVAVISALLIGTSLGFLVFNFKPAKIYLGDGGSTLLGFLLACISLYGEWSSWDPIVAIGIPILILGILIFDMIYITISRIKNGNVRNIKQWLDYRGQDHFHHRLINLGFKEDGAVVFIYTVCIILGLSALVIDHARVSYPVVVLLIQATLIFINISILMLTGRQVVIDEKKD